MTKEITETDLVSLIRQRNAHGFSVLYEKHASILFDLIVKIVGDNTPSEEILERTFVKIWSDIGYYDQKKEGLLTWIINIARTLSIEYTRDRRKSNQHDEGNTPNDDILMDLDHYYVEAIEMIFLKGYSYDQAAGILMISTEALKNRVRTALQLLRKQ